MKAYGKAEGFNKVKIVYTKGRMDGGVSIEEDHDDTWRKFSLSGL